MPLKRLQFLCAPACSRCASLMLDDPVGALVFSPQYKGSVDKYHLCAHCWAQLAQWLDMPVPVSKQKQSSKNKV